MIAFYLDYRDEIDRYVAENQREIDRQRASARKGPSLAELRARFAAMTRAKGA